MSDPHQSILRYLISRRRFLGYSAAAAAASLGSSWAGSAQSADVKLVFWEYKDPPESDAYKYYQAAADRFRKKTAIQAEVAFKSAEGIEQAVAAAANARSGFDTLLWWSGPTARNQASLGNVVALEDKIPASVWKYKMGLESLQYEGHQYAMPFDVSPWFLVYNKKILEKAGVSRDAFPAPTDEPIAWTDFLDICGRIKKNASVAPLMWANKEGYFNEWYIYNFEGQAFDTTAEIEAVNLGDGSWQNPEVYSALDAYKQLYDAGYFVEGGEVVPYEQHVQQFAGGQAAMSLYFDMSGATSAAAEAFGKENIGFTKIPAFRRDKKLFDHMSQEPNAHYVASFGQHQEAALKWVEHLASVPEMNEYARATQSAPADTRWDHSVIKDPAVRAVFEGSADKNQVYPYDFATQAQYESLLRNGILFLKGEWSGQELCADWDKVDKAYKEQQKAG